MSEPTSQRRQLRAPTWAKLLPAFFAVLENGTDEGKRIAREELARMAKAADFWNASQPEAEELEPAPEPEPFNAKAYSVFGYEGDSTEGQPAFAAYSPSLEAARGDVKAYRADFPKVRLWHVIDNATGDTETMLTKTDQ
jgi:hypothetical protein